MEKIRHHAYLEERKMLIDAEREAARSFDKTLVSLAAGALGFSLAFVRLFGGNTIVNKYQVILSWVFFALSLVVILLSFVMSQSAIRRQREILDDKHTKENSSENNIFSVVTNWLNFGAIILFIIGVIFLSLFSGTNLLSVGG